MNPALRVFDDVLGLLPTPENPSPLIRINRLNPQPRSRLYAKVEWLNPFGSVKDRAAAAMLRDLVARGEVSATRGIVEPTSGNTGLSMAAMAGVLGFHMRAVVPDRVPFEKKVLLKIAGAELDVVNDALCPSPGLGEGSINLAKTRARAESERYAMPNQYENELNVKAHYETTGPEIWRQTEGRITHLFVTLGTCGTAMGCGRFLKDQNSSMKIVAVQPEVGHDIPGIRNLAELGVSKFFDPSLFDEILEVESGFAYSRAMDLARLEGLLAGPSSGLVLEGARRFLGRERAGLSVMIFADNIFKYVSNMVRHRPDLAVDTRP